MASYLIIVRRKRISNLLHRQDCLYLVNLSLHVHVKTHNIQQNIIQNSCIFFPVSCLSFNWIPLLGSVTAANCKELAAQPDVDGFLVGGASLKVMMLLLSLSPSPLFVFVHKSMCITVGSNPDIFVVSSRSSLTLSSLLRSRRMPKF